MDTTQLADTITKDTLKAAHNLAEDGNPYEVRAIAVLSNDSDDMEDPATQPTDSFSVDNVDDVGPLGPTNLVVTEVKGTDTFKDNGDGSYTVGGLVDIYDDNVPPPTVVFTVTPTARRETYKTLKLIGIDLPADVKIVKDMTEASPGVFEVTVEIPQDTDELKAESGPYTFYALAIDQPNTYPEADAGEPNSQTHNLDENGDLVDTNEMPSVGITAVNTYRPNPGILAITVDDAEDTNPDSGAPRGIVVLNGYTHEITSPATESVRFEVYNDLLSEWTPVGTAELADATTATDEKALEGLVTGIVSSGSGIEVPIVSQVGPPPDDIVPQKWKVNQKWSLAVDTTKLADTITMDDLDEAHGLSEDDNKYWVRAVAITPKRSENPETISADGVTASFSVDNIDDVGPLGPTHITMVSDIAGQIVANDDSSYTVGGIVAVADETQTRTSGKHSNLYY